MPPQTKQRKRKRVRECEESKRYPMYIWNHEIDDPIGMKTGMTLLKLAILAKNESAVKALVERRTKKGLPIDDPISVSTTAMYGMVNVLKTTNLHTAMASGNAEIVRSVVACVREPHFHPLLTLRTHVCHFIHKLTLSSFTYS